MFHLTKLLKGPSNPALNTCRDGAPTASLDKLHSAVTPPLTHTPHQLMTTSPYSPVSLAWYLLVLAHCHMHLHLLQLLVPKSPNSKINRCFWWCYILFCSGLLQSSTYRNFAEAILEKQSIVAFIPLGNEKTKLPIMTKLYLLPGKLWHRIRKSVFAAYSQKHLRLLLLSAERKKSSQNDPCTMQSSSIQKTQDEESKYCLHDCLLKILSCWHSLWGTTFQRKRAMVPCLPLGCFFWGVKGN